MDSQAKGLIKGLENWAKRVTTGYKDVNVQNMSSSFRDGLAFCAIIHHYRPDLISFESLNRNNILENNSLAFSVAEKQLGVPALLDAEDMVKYEKPDRLSIITYLSQLHNCFENQNKVKTLKPTKRPQGNSVGPPSKVTVVRPSVFPTNRNEVCHACNHRVFILERLLVDSKLYHTTCFRCSKCQCLLNPGTYVESDTPGLYECAVCLPEENSYSMETQDTSYDSPEEKNGSINDTAIKSPSPLAQNNTPSKSPILETVNNARSNFLQHSLASKSPELKKFSPNLRNGTSASENIKRKSVLEESCDSGISVKDKISVFESNRNSRTESIFKTSETSNSSTLTSSPTSPNSDFPASAKSPRTSAIFSLNSSSTAKPQEASSSVEFSEKILVAGNIDASISKETPKASLRFSSQLSKTSDSESDKPNCDNSTSSILNKVPNSTARHSLQFESSSKEENTSKISPNKYQIGEYKSPFKTSRDIFQTSLPPLKLSIPTASSTPKKESSSLPLTPITSTPDSSRISSIEIPQIRSTYAKTLPRPGSDGSLTPKDKANEPSSSSETNLSSNVFLSKWSNTTPRRSSLGSNDKSGLTVSQDASGSIKSLSEVKTEISVASPKEKDRFQYPNNLGISLRNESSPFKKELSSTPVPSIRHSLEIKKLGTTKTEPNVDVNTSIISPRISSEKPEVKQPVDVLQKSRKQLSQNESNIVANKEIAKAEVVESSKAEKLYPDDLNPFGDDDEEEEYPDDLNPFGDDEEEVQNNTVHTSGVKVVLSDDYDESKNPFASDDDDTDATIPQPKTVPPRPPPAQINSSFSQNGSYTSMSPTGSLRGTMKKRLAPKPPKLSDIFPNDSQDSEADVSMNSLKSSPTGSRVSLQTPSPKLRKSKPAPPPPPVPPNRQISQADVIANSKQMKDADNMKLKSTSASAAADKEASKQAKKKKRPAPPVPIPKRKDNKKIPLKEIIREMKEIEEKQRECERQGREIEILIRDRDKDEEASVEEEEYIMQLFELVNQKNALFRRQAELMYIKRSQRLEEQQAEIELQIRQLIENPDKNEEDKVKEEELILELMDIVDQRNCIIDSIEMDRRRELEEDASVQEQIEIKNGIYKFCVCVLCFACGHAYVIIFAPL
ncbi:MICAL-like protein 2 [Nephila pilipes]|uniref:MICAL-like protein 2 n=1 Tax=Nephila pilipes TaxID=299642 RepID=A0A8X6UND6_NEPPI|nr:MICAL-like protein 2 [Nephila pilipes]